MFQPSPQAISFIQELTSARLQDGLNRPEDADTILNLIRKDGDVYHCVTRIAHTKFSPNQTRVDVLASWEASNVLPGALKNTFGDRAHDMARHIAEVIAGPAPGR